MSFRVQFGNGRADTKTEEFQTEERAELRAAEVVKLGARYVVIYEVGEAVA